MSLMKERYRVLRRLTVRQSGADEVGKERCFSWKLSIDKKLPGRVEEECYKWGAGSVKAQTWERAEQV